MHERIEYWAPRVTKLPRFVTNKDHSATHRESLYYPYWLVPIAISVKLPFLPLQKKFVWVAVDAFRGSANLAPGGGRGCTLFSVCGLRLADIPSFLEMTDEGVISRVAHSSLPAKLRMWSMATSEIGEARLVFKELMVFEIEFENGGAATLTLDTLSGEYGVVCPQNQNSEKVA